jgi:hypothetical protein
MSLGKIIRPETLARRSYGRSALGFLFVLSSVATQGSQQRFSLKSEYQPGTLSVNVLTPDTIPAKAHLRVIYVLPVEPLDQDNYGDALDVIEHLDLQNKYQAIFVAPEFAQMPWYADHPSDPLRRQESYLLRAIVPFVENHFPVLRKPSGRLLLGFSKSGWGAFSLLLRHPDVFGAAAAWDAPFSRLKPDAYDMIDIFGTQANFDHYCIFNLLRKRGQFVGKNHRFVVLGYALFQEDASAVHTLMNDLGIPHVYSNNHWSKHAWDSEWVPTAVALLLETEPAGR